MYKAGNAMNGISYRELIIEALFEVVCSDLLLLYTIQ